ncbi:hypothetical protein M569_15565 [Genlisea aurea]|uniref:S-protein homolog n=1 Tax=Genlisea aurea TaxID=192259 RepID=S8D950_9LAMI|nr:hypothetical protein M569_15565 [Genlisea aurea]
MDALLIHRSTEEGEKKKMNKFRSIVCLVAIVAVSLSEACIFTTKQHIILLRDMKSSNKPVKVHCHSENDDNFDDQWLQGSERYEQTFCENAFWRSTKFTCNLWWDEEIREFVAFDEKTDYKTKLMIWYIREDGIYNTHDWATPAVKKYDWIVIDDADAQYPIIKY